MSWRRRIIFWILFCLFISSTALYLTWVPYRPTDLYRAIPAHAILVSSHYDLAGRWHALATNVIIKSFISPSIPLPGQQRESTATARAQQWINRLARKETVLAYVPVLGPDREPAWVCASWIGSSSHYLRWALCVKHIPELDRQVRYCHGRPIWTFRQPLTYSGARLSLAFGEGIVMACLARNPDAMRHVIMAYEGLTPSMVSSPAYHPELRSLGRSAGADSRPTSQGTSGTAVVMDQGWLRLIQPGKKLSETLMLSYAIPRLDAIPLTAEIRVNPKLKPRLPLATTADLPAFGQLLGDLPVMAGIIPLDIIRDLLSQAPAAANLHVVRQALRSDVFPARDNNLVVTLLTGDYGAGFGKEPFRVKIPALTVFLKLRNPDEGKAIITETLDNLNAHYRLGLIIDPSALSAGKMSVYTIEATRANIFSALDTEDRPAYAVVGSWLICSSNARGLVKLLERFQNPAMASNPAPGRWQQQLVESKASAFLWMDLDICGKALQLPLTALAMSQPGRESSPASNSREIIKTIKTWLEDVRPLKTGSLWMESGASAPGFNLVIGERSPAAGKSD